MSKTIDLSTIFITDLSLHSIGIILYRLKNFSLFSSFVGDVIVEGVGILSLPPEDLIVKPTITYTPIESGVRNPASEEEGLLFPKMPTYFHIL